MVDLRFLGRPSENLGLVSGQSACPTYRSPHSEYVEAEDAEDGAVRHGLPAWPGRFRGSQAPGRFRIKLGQAGSRVWAESVPQTTKTEDSHCAFQNTTEKTAFDLSFAQIFVSH